MTLDVQAVFYLYIMKKLLLFTALLIFTSGLSAQNTFNKRLRFDFLAAVLTSIQPTDSCYYATGIIADTIFPYNTGNVFVKFDLEGNVQLLKTITDTLATYETWRETLSFTHEGNLAVSGFSIDSTAKLMIIKYDTEGDTLFLKKHFSFFYPDTHFAGPTAMGITSENGFIIGDRNENPNGTNNYDMILLKLDSLGNLIWKKKYGDPYFDRPGSIIIQEDGYIIGGIKDNTTLVNSNYFSQVHIFKVDTAGQMIWNYLSPFHRLMDEAHSMVATEDGGLVIASANGIEENNSSVNGLYWKSGLIFKLNANRQIEWECEFRDPTFPTLFNSFSKVVPVSDGSGFVATGYFVETYPNLHQDLHGWLVKASPEGDSLWSRKLRFLDSYGDRHFLYDVKETVDGGFIMVGQAKEFNAPAYPQQAWILKVDQYGCLVPGCHLINDLDEAEVDAFRLILYPNPVSDYLNIYYQARSLPKNGRFTIMNAEGKVVREFAATQNDVTQILPVYDWAKGGYFLQFWEGVELRGSRKFLVQ
ncbi:MAG: hypothetical protein DHS20C18_08160 [Saprospiraceae bacterium]|nr:MAG: hypothetical protein DHS20C18_08160 [Saprospiraceae bacterium]